MNFYRILIFGLILLVITAPAAFAYTDPGSGILIWQFIAAAFMGGMFYFHKIKSWFIAKIRGKKNDE